MTMSAVGGASAVAWSGPQHNRPSEPKPAKLRWMRALTASILSRLHVSGYQCKEHREMRGTVRVIRHLRDRHGLRGMTPMARGMPTWRPIAPTPLRHVDPSPAVDTVTLTTDVDAEQPVWPSITLAVPSPDTCTGSPRRGVCAVPPRRRGFDSMRTRHGIREKLPVTELRSSRSTPVPSWMRSSVHAA